MVVMLLWLVWSINGELVGVKGPSPLNVAEVPGLNHANRSLTPRRRLLYFPVVPHEVAVNDHVQVINERPIAILGQTHAEGVQTEQNTYAVDGVFVLRDAVAPDKLVPGLAVEGAHVRVDANMATNLSGCFACGDLAGKPYQYIKAAGQGNVAALSAVEWLAKQKK